MQTENLNEIEVAYNVKTLWLHLGIYDVFQNLFSWIDKFIISLILTSSISAIYYNGTMNIPFLPLLLSAAGSAVLMQLASGIKTDEVSDSIRLMNQSGKILSSIVFPLFFFLFVYRYDLIIGLFSLKYIKAIPIFAASLLVLPLRAYSFTTILQRFHKGNILNIGALSDLFIGCLLMYPFYKWLGLPGVALSFVISTYLQAIFYLHFSAKALSIKFWHLIPYKNWITKILIFGGCTVITHNLSNKLFTSYLGLLFGFILMSVMVIVALGIELYSKNKTSASLQ